MARQSEDVSEQIFQRFTAAVPIAIRLCRREDLPHLEWFGCYTEHRAIIHSAFERQERGDNIMLVAETNAFPIGQAWIDLVKRGRRGPALLWAVRVLTPFRQLGIGERLMIAAEDAIRRCGLSIAEVGVERTNPGARRFYERLGYQAAGTLHEEYTYVTPEGRSMRVPVDQWVLRKTLIDAPENQE